MEKTKDDVADLASLLGDKELAEEVAEARAQKNRDSVMEKMFEFFQAKLALHKDEDELHDAVIEKLKQKLTSDTEQLTFGQLMQLYKALKESSAQQLRSMVELVRPVPNATSPLVGVQTARDDVPPAALPPSDTAVAIDRVMRTMMNAVAQKGKVIDVPEEPTT